ncbi:hypothetical protein BPT24_238 [Tenacibaculum phage pT24]|uniref:Uncharacterized protein n=1 Tax=Tenacibaculum phage pT24 TaxID=1880590 RepID=A0A1B4XX39_9CAUD|nr:hypothetical protein HYP10_gp290 [Tenacibaculum phage pT24]BAV39358.1 hypothetical protein BPT24_238 [Tenacibaculum phage pT24]
MLNDRFNNRFTAPKSRKSHKRVPRRLKKRFKIVFSDRYDFLSLDQKIWFIGWEINPDYNQFLINKIIEDEKQTMRD